MRFRNLQTADDDIQAAIAHLEKERRGTGHKFFAAYKTAFANIKRFPQLYSLVEDEHPPHEIRNAILERYNYRIVYLVRPNEVVILAVAHTDRRPGHWHRRLDDPSLT